MKSLSALESEYREAIIELNDSYRALSHADTPYLTVAISRYNLARERFDALYKEIKEGSKC